MEILTLVPNLITSITLLLQVLRNYYYYYCITYLQVILLHLVNTSVVTQCIIIVTTPIYLFTCIWDKQLFYRCLFSHSCLHRLSSSPTHKEFTHRYKQTHTRTQRSVMILTVYSISTIQYKILRSSQGFTHE